MKYIAPVIVVIISCQELKAVAQATSPECTGANLGALIGLLINPRANTSNAIPEHCRGGGNSNSQRPATQQEIDATVRKSMRDFNRKSDQDSWERQRTYFPYNGY